MDTESHHPSYIAIWAWLVALLAGGLMVAYVPIGRAMAIFLIFSIAGVKALLVARYYMHLRTETLLIHAIAAIPVLLLVGMMLALVPDVVFNR
jgi:cytochrome c oxidase subunit 4